MQGTTSASKHKWTLEISRSTSTLEIFPSTSALEIFPSTSSLEIEIQKYVQIRDFGLYRHSKSSSITEARLRLAFSKALGFGNASQVLSLVFELLRRIL